MIGVIGTRSLALSSILDDLNASYEVLSDQTNISNNHSVIFASGVHYKIKNEYLHKPLRGIIGFHETDLPIGAGCAPLPWTLILGFQKFAVSMFRFTMNFDDGPIIDKAYYDVEDSDDICVLERKRDHGINYLMNHHIRKILSGDVKYVSQDSLNLPHIVFPRRFPSQSTMPPELANRPIWQVWKTHIRACHNDHYPCVYRNKRLQYTSGISDNHVSSNLKFCNVDIPFSFTIDKRNIRINFQK